jgi:hypothetical protein
MVEINLLPWRNYLRSYQKKMIKKIMMITLIMALIGIAIFHQILSIQEKILEARIDDLQNKLADRNSLPKPEKVSLPKPPYELILLLRELKNMPHSSLCFTSITRHHNITAFKGKAHSIINFTDYLKNWTAAFLFSYIKIQQLDAKDKSLINFHFTAVDF